MKYTKTVRQLNLTIGLQLAQNTRKMAVLKVGLSPSKKICVICLIESPLKMLKNAFYFILKALFVLKIF